MKNIIYILLFLIPFSGFSQKYADKDYYLIDNLILDSLSDNTTELIDSCLKIFHNATHDTIKVQAIGILVEFCWDDNVWPKYNQWEHNFVKKKLTTNLSPREIIHFKNSLAITLNNMGYFAQHQGNISKALEFYFKSLKIQEEIEDKKGCAIAYNNIGTIYDIQKNPTKSLEYYHKSLKILEEIDDKRGISLCLNNIGVIYKNQANLNKISTKERNALLNKALSNFQKSLKIRTLIGAEKEITFSLNNIGLVYKKQDSLDLAISYFHQALDINENNKDQQGIAISLNNIGAVLHDKNKTVEAQNYVQKGLAIAEEIGFPEIIKESARLLSEIYEKQNKGIKALSMHRLYIQMKDSINNDAIIKTTAQQIAKYNYEKQKAIDDAENEKLIAIEKEKKEKQQILIIAVVIGLILVSVFLLFVVNRLRVTKKQKVVIEKQHATLAEKNIQITDSIDYAKRIQQGMFPSKTDVHEIFNEICIYHNPKDIVSGDFYWVFKKGNKKYLAVVDCTGHGVPGAFMTIIGINILNQIMEKGLAEKPHEIIQKLNFRIRQLLNSRDNTKDGMDIGLICIEDNTLEFSGTHISCYIKSDDEMLELKGERGFIGYANELNVKTQTAQIDKANMVYMFTDGYPDQKGGELRKKYYYPPLIDFLEKISKEDVDKQHHKLKEDFKKWKGTIEQLDDVLVVGLKI